MARSEEKQNNMYNKWQVLKREQNGDLGLGDQRRPHLSHLCKSLGEAEKWRREIVAEVTKDVSLIQNASLGEAKIRELNDNINKLMRTRHQWNLRIRELGGADYRSVKTAVDVEGKELPGETGGGGAYKYYGAAKELPGVREKFEEFAGILAVSEEQKKRSLKDVYRRLTPEYYGFGEEEEDPRWLAKERARERELQQEAMASFKEKRVKAEADVERSGGVFGQAASAALTALAADDDDEIDATALDLYEAGAAAGVGAVASYVAIPDEDDIARLVMEEKKKKMLAMLA